MSASVTLVCTVRLLAVVMTAPVEAAGAEPARGLAALGITALVTGVQLPLRGFVSRGRVRAIAVLLLDLAAGGAVLVLAGAGQAAGYHSLGSAALAAALLGVPGVLLALGEGLGVAVLAAWLPTTGEPLPPVAAAGLPARYVLVAVLVAVVRHVLSEEVALREDLRLASARAARAEERQRLSRDLHDFATATLAGIRLSVAALRAIVTAEATAASSPRLDAAARLAARVEDAAHRASFETRLVVGDLRAEAEGGGRLDEAVRRVVVAWQRGSTPTGVDLDLDLAAVPEPDPAVRAELLAVLREALLNVSRHADANRVHVGLAGDGSTARLTVADDGRGFAVPPDLASLTDAGHFGLAGMADRVGTVGGLLRVAGRHGGGTLLTVEVPVTPAAVAVPAVRR